MQSKLKILESLIRSEVKKQINEAVTTGDTVVMTIPYMNSQLKFAGTVTKVSGSKCTVKYTTSVGGEKVTHTTEVPISAVEVKK